MFSLLKKHIFAILVLMILNYLIHYIMFLEETDIKIIHLETVGGGVDISVIALFLC